MTVDLVLVLVSWALSQAPSRSGPVAPPTAAMVDRITCDATLRRAGSARTESMSPKPHGATYLFVGDEVRCTSNKGYLVLIVSGSEPKLITAKDGPYRVRIDPPTATSRARLEKPPSTVDPETAKAQQELAALVAQTLRHHGRRGATRGGSGAQTVIYPAASGIAWPAGFVIRWNPDLASSKLNLSIWRVGGTEALWTETDVDGRRGFLDSPAAKQALTQAAAANPSAQQMYVLQFNDKPPTAIPFRVLSSGDARGLERELSLWATQKNELLRLVGRAYSFDTRQLFWEAAHEYKAAFELTGSCDMLNEAIAAAARAGDDGLVRLLTERRSKFTGGCADRHR